MSLGSSQDLNHENDEKDRPKNEPQTQRCKFWPWKSKIGEYQKPDHEISSDQLLRKDPDNLVHILILI